MHFIATSCPNKISGAISAGNVKQMFNGLVPKQRGWYLSCKGLSFLEKPLCLCVRTHKRGGGGRERPRETVT